MAYIRKTRDEFDIEADHGYGYGYEVETSEETRKAAREQLKTYRENGITVPMRIVKRRVPIGTQEVNK